MTEPVEIDVFIHQTTQRAVLVSTDGEEAGAVWLPRSQIGIEPRRGKLAVVTMPEWLAEREGLV